MLGYETAKWMGQGLNAVDWNASRTADLQAALAQAEFQSPRGQFTLNPETRQTSTPLYLREAQQHNGTLSNEIISELGSISEIDGHAASVRSGVKTGW